MVVIDNNHTKGSMKNYIRIKCESNKNPKLMENPWLGLLDAHDMHGPHYILGGCTVLNMYKYT